MAHQQAAQRPGSSGGVERNGRRPSAPIQFEPELAVKAIVYHLVDEGVTASVADDSVRASVLRLRRASCRPAIEQWVWSEMTNPQRLEWLMEKTDTVARLVSDELSILEPAPRK